MGSENTGKTAGKSRGRDALSQHRVFLSEASAMARLPVNRGGSPHPSVHVGAVLVGKNGKVLAKASNRFARGVDRRRPERYANGSKSSWINCAEQMAICDAARNGAAIKGARLYVTLEPCAVCAGIIAEAGINEVIVPVGAMRSYARLKSKWKQSIEIGMVKLSEAGVSLLSVDSGQPPAVEKRTQKAFRGTVNHSP